MFASLWAASLHLSPPMFSGLDFCWHRYCFAWIHTVHTYIHYNNRPWTGIEIMEQESYKRLLILEMLPILLCVWCCWAPRLTVYVCMYVCMYVWMQKYLHVWIGIQTLFSVEVYRRFTMRKKFNSINRLTQMCVHMYCTVCTDYIPRFSLAAVATICFRLFCFFGMYTTKTCVGGMKCMYSTWSYVWLQLCNLLSYMPWATPTLRHIGRRAHSDRAPVHHYYT